MNRTSPAQLERARHLLSSEGADGSAAGCAEAAGRIFEKLHARLAPLVGAAGVQALLVRSATLAHGDLGPLDTAVVETPAKLRDFLRAQEPAIACETATTYFGAFLALMATFIGERLTTQVLRGAWPTIEDVAPKERRE
jgi:hypothetical protein